MTKILCKICNSLTKTYNKGLYDNRHGYPGRFSLEKCSNCGFIQTNPQLSFNQLTAVYTRYYPKRDADIKSIIEYSKNIPVKKEIYFKGLSTTCHFQTKKGQNVLDIGCGTCQSLLEIQKLGGKAWGLDPDKNSLKVAKKRKLNFHLGTIHNCKFPKNKFDLITASQVLEHEKDPVKFLIDCKGFLKANGRLIMSFPNTDALSNKIWGRNWLHWHIPYHLNHFNKKSFEILAKKTDYKIVSFKTATPNLWTLLQIRSFLNNVKEGQRDTLWDTGQDTNNRDTKQSILKVILSKSLPFLNRLLIVNRFVDMLGLGESFVVELKPS